jgi:DNA-nicking Smr family endonuclease
MSGRGSGRVLSEQEAAFWERATRGITPLDPARPGLPRASGPASSALPCPSAEPAPKRIKGRVPPQLPPKPLPAAAQAATPHLDGSWEKRIARGTLQPDYSLDLHGSNLDQAWRRLMDGLGQAKAMGARVVLVVTGKPRPVDAADRASSRGAIRAKLTDWIAASDHAHDVVAVRSAHRRHGGHGAVYVVLRRRK